MTISFLHSFNFDYLLDKEKDFAFYFLLLYIYVTCVFKV